MSSGNLDDVLDCLRELSSLLSGANGELLPSYSKMMDALAELNPHWKDKTRLQHDQIATDLFQSVDRTLHYDIPEVCAFLDERIRKLEAYFES